MHTPFSKILVKCQNQASASDHSLYDIFDPQKVPLLKTSDDVIACDLWFELPPIKIPGYAYSTHRHYLDTTSLSGFLVPMVSTSNHFRVRIYVFGFGPVLVGPFTTPW